MPPTQLVNSLHSIRQKVRWFALAFGAGVVCAAGITLLLLVILADYLLNLPALPRVVVIAAALGAIGYATWRWIITPALTQMSIGDIAGRLEHAFPQFDDRLRSTVNFLKQDQPGSQVMKDRVVAEATAMASSLDLSRAIERRPVWYSLGAACCSLLVILGVALLVNHYNPRLLNIAASRLFTPFHALAWPKSVQIELLGDTPDLVPVGQSVPVSVRLTRGDSSSRKVILHSRAGAGREQLQEMLRGADGTYAATLDTTAAGGELTFWVEAGDDRIAPHPIRVVPRLAIGHIVAEITPPPYARGQVVSTDLTTAPAIAATGSGVRVKVSFNQPLDPSHPLELMPAAGDGAIGGAMTSDGASAQSALPVVAWTMVNPTTAAGVWSADRSMRFHLRATDTHGFHNIALEEFELIVKPDMSPTVQIENPRRNEERTAEATIPLQAVADDDYGIDAASLMVSRLTPKPEDRRGWEIPLVVGERGVKGVTFKPVDGSADRLRYRLAYGWELPKLDQVALQPGDVLEYAVRVRDNFLLPGAPSGDLLVAAPGKSGHVIHPPVDSGKLRITIISQEQFANRLLEEFRVVAAQVVELRNSQDRTKQETEDFRKDTKDHGELTKADRAVLDRLVNQQTTAASQTKQLTSKLDAMRRRMDENHLRKESDDLRQLASDVEDQLNQAADQSMKDAVNQLANAKQQSAAPNASQEEQKKTSEERDKTLKTAQDNQQEASQKLQNALDRMKDIGSLQRSIDSIRRILQKQQELSASLAELGRKNLGKTPEQMSGEDREKLAKLAKEQAELSAQTQKSLDEMRKTAEQMQKSDPTSADAMKQGADTGQQQQVPQKQSKAAQAAGDNQQASAQAAQKQAELGLQMILNDLREAEQRKLEELSKKLESMREQVANLIRRQAGHNLDNLHLQGDAALKKLDEKLLADLLEKAHREKPSDAPVPTLSQLSTAQEQTERNTRDIAKAVEEMPTGAEAAGHLTRAAGEMERANVSLHDQKLADAYDPSQVRALASLGEALQRILDQQKKINEKIADQQRETIRQAYEKIRDAQKKVNAQTHDINAAKGAGDQTLKREDLVRLGQLSGDQQKLVDQTAKLNEDLSSLGSIVYIWANKDIVSAMKSVKEDLAQRSTGELTQARQERIVQQLEDMIKNLAIKPRQSKFDQAQNGGGGGDGKPKPSLPTEAELRLLKALQLTVNEETKAIDAAGQVDKARTVAVGGRQGELRNLLDSLLKKASDGKMGLGPEPDNKDQLPEEAREEQIENQELDQNLLTGQPDQEPVERDVHLVGDRMARSRQRLAINSDPGTTTQKIQDRIVIDLDDLIQQSQKTVSATPRPGQGQPQGQQQPADAQGKQPGNQQADGKDSGAQSQANSSKQAANQSTLHGGGNTNADLSQDIKEKMAEWGGITPRQRQAVIEGAGETVIQKYQKLVEDYYRSLAIKQTERP